MPSDPRSHWTLGYCTNIHAGTEVPQICDTLKNISAEVGRIRQADGRLGVGLWLPRAACTTLRRHGMPPLVKAIAQNKLLAYTINGFPFEDFHKERVKHDVYQPTWWTDERVAYTRDLAKVLAELLPEKTTTGTISTLPIGWPKQVDEHESNDRELRLRDASEEEVHHAGTNFRRLAEDLRMLENRTGKRIIVAIEPEPGCLLERADQLVEWFETQLPDPTHRRYIGVCHDVCHSAVMMEDQRKTLQRYADAGIVLGKIQISSAVVADWQSIDAADHEATLQQLRSFAEDRYLHQTGRLLADGSFELAEDLPELLDQMTHTPVTDQRWVIHFHVPIFMQKFGHLRTTQDQIAETLDAVEQLSASPVKGSSRNKRPLEFTGHLEVETYAWSVLPEDMRSGDLAVDIAHELDWLNELL
ncbi:metabolite traffic protein EboE [Allorhodopirellula heiligendammensis]|uniref:Xylose isomerase-like TIM barrel n=1 Tax=Allorhodopirellula heiligendammensis TaxID=2714739 RepID=A0A5C6C8Y5_9BACT|nr:metabolite traffic protein EboE [Allorhodopirellula heiligendammensis]TWU19891.1 Xylose isomerase-like TIM barrel [Allorhodopirellula heiligendammensis]